MVKEKEQQDDFKSADEINIVEGETGHTSKKSEVDTNEEESKSEDNKSTDLGDKKSEKDSEVETLRKELAKERAEKDNYRKGLLSSKKKLKSLDSKKKKKEEDEGNEWDEDSSKFQKETLEKSEKIAKEAIYTSNSNSAIQNFVSKYPEADKGDVWKDISAAYSPRRGKDSVDNIVSDIEDAYLIVKRDRGEIVDVEEVLRGEQKGITKAAKADLASTKSKGGATEKSDKKDVSKGAIVMANNFKNDPKKVAEEDDIAVATVEL